MCWNCRQENVDDDHGKTPKPNDDLCGNPRNKPSSKECVGTPDDREWQVLHADLDETVSSNGLHVDIHVPEEYAQAHKGTEGCEHENAKRRRFPDVERQYGGFSDLRFPICEGGEMN